MPPGDADPLAALRADPARAGVFLDFDGTLAPIVSRPEDARPAPGAREAVAALVPRFAAVAVITGRPSAEVRRLLDVEGVRYAGLYGLEEAAPEADPGPLQARAEAVAAGLEGVRVEPKGLSVAVHYRRAPDPDAARRALEPELARLADGTGFEVIEGKMVLELVPAGESRKGGALRRLLGETAVRSALYAGDDVADLEAFAVLAGLAARGAVAVRVAVGGPEAPPELLEAADVTVDGPSGLVELLRSLA